MFGVDEQVPRRGQSDKEGFGPRVSPQLVQSGKGRIASDPALLNLPRPLMVGAFSYGVFLATLHFLDNQRSVKWLTHLSRSAPLKSGPGDIDLTPLRGRRGTETRTN